jgi:transcriptional regulator
LRNCPFLSIILNNYSKEEIAKQLKKVTNNRAGRKRAEKLIETAKRSISIEGNFRSRVA